ncbi:MAG: GGDEF domain-containing protein [Aquificaceae bacterium]
MDWESYAGLFFAMIFLAVGLTTDFKLLRKLAVLYSSSFLLMSAANFISSYNPSVKQPLVALSYVILAAIFFYNYAFASSFRKSSNKAYVDPLTGARNRLFFEEVFKSEVKRLIAFDIQFAIFFVDVDCLKYVNDTMGHEKGDLLLKTVGNALISSARSRQDVIVRIGGDEFVLLCLIKLCSESLIIAQRIEEALQSARERVSLPVSASIGFACYPEDGKTLDTLIEVADKRMYAIKNQKRNAGNICKGRT